MKQSFTSTEITVFLREGRNVEIITEYLYDTVKNKIHAFVRKFGGSYQDGQDLIQDSLIALLRNIREDRLPKDSEINVEPYLFGIAQNLWKTRYKQGIQREKRQFFFAEESMNNETSPIDILEKEEFWKILDTLGDVCKLILRAYYQSGYSIEEIAEKYNLGSTNTVKVRKFRCIEKLKTQFQL
jgi:RNA polymerase sigma factor (sigma-70 family)